MMEKKRSFKLPLTTKNAHLASRSIDLSGEPSLQRIESLQGQKLSPRKQIDKMHYNLIIDDIISRSNFINDAPGEETRKGHPLTKIESSQRFLHP